ncbi:TonB-dependent receptor [Granulicella sp. S156]|uniref:TonB-dependent receptor n=1 Tax=Granulicella sp. S156 TaxID=1747224 RepID=UPI00131D600E|nr:TonB-dependent receptor [Granulicella sp. S156]
MKNLLFAASLAAFALPHAFAETACKGTTITGIVRDSTLALIPGAMITLDNNQNEESGSDGSFRFTCISDGPHHLSVSVGGFAKRDLSVTTPHSGQLAFVLKPEAVESEVDVTADSGPSTSTTSAGPSQTISGKRLQSLADDPDDLLRELQQMAAAAGGAPGNATLSLDGFLGEGDGNITLPPKSSIAYIKVNPDLFSAEYRNPPFGGGRIEIYTKPGLSAFHGALFATNGSPWMNARDPFSTSKASLGKQRYGFELTGPIFKKGSDFTMTLEHRSIDNFAVVNATTVDSSGNQSPIVQNVATPQRLWIGTVRTDWQLGPKNTFIASFDANVNHFVNVGVGGQSLAETGYDQEKYDYTLHLTDVTTISPKLMHEARLGIEWDGSDDTPNSTAPQVQVAGAFTAGGSTAGPLRDREVDIEMDDDAILSTAKHLLKFGVQAEVLDEHLRLPTNFNGVYTFGGGTVPGQTTTLTGIQQYVLALNGQPNGSPTDYSNVAGNPEVDLVQTRVALFYQDDWKVRSNLHIAYGLRYFTQTDPTVSNNFTPRLGVTWSPDKKSTWTIHGHAGLFSGRFRAHTYGEVLRMDGVERVTSTIYNPTCTGIFDPATCNPFNGGTPIHSIRTVAPNFPNTFYSIENIGLSHTLPHGWNFSGDYYIAQIWHLTRTENINSPLNDSPIGPRPGASDLNVLQMQGTGRGYGNVEFMGLEQHSLKHVQFFMGAVRVQIIDDGDGNGNTGSSEFNTPQTTGSNAGEYARSTGNGLWQVFGNATFTLPEKIQLSGNFNASGDAPYNITTGFDNNGDGDFNDRPQYAAPGTPGAISTPYGLLVTSGGTGFLPRNKGVMPWTFYLDSNIQRTFTLTRNPKAEHQQTLQVNIRSSNLLNHTNVTQVGGVLGSPSFGQAYAADNGRRVEGGVRYSF